jgi:SagB-type dehydrogenase family enzyme
MVDSVSNPLGDVFLRKTSPSGGALHPIEIYPVLLNVTGMPRGLFHYSVRLHALDEISLEDPREWIVKATGDQEWVAEAGVVFLCTAFLPRTSWKYQYSRVARAVIAEFGFSGEAALLTATWMGLGSFTTIALRDQIWEVKLELDPRREPVIGLF